MKVGILGGTFDPVHNGHLAIAEEVRARLNLDEVLFVPAGQPWMKSARVIASAGHRAEMVRLAISGKSYFRLSLVEIKKRGLSFTVETLEELHHEYGGGAELYFIMGWDSLPDLPRWKEPARIIALAVLVAVVRPGYGKPELRLLARQVPGLSERVVLLEEPAVDISATEIRRRVAKGLDIGHLVPAAVAEYIKENKLYEE